MTAAQASSARHLLSICTTCRRTGTPPDARRDGAILLDAVHAAFERLPDRTDIVVAGIECMSGCDRACTVGLSAPGKPSYLFGDQMPTGEAAIQALDLVRQYRDAPDGALRRGERPDLFRSGILARIPMLP